MKKIVITGGLGYIGTELCKIYSGYSWNDKITVIDNRFISERVNQIRNWNMNFIHGDILDKELIYKHCHDADVVHHLAGVTAVPRVLSEADNEKEKIIYESNSINKKFKLSFKSYWYNKKYNTNPGKYTHIAYKIIMHFLTNTKVFEFKNLSSGGKININAPLYHYDNYELIPSN